MMDTSLMYNAFMKDMPGTILQFEAIGTKWMFSFSSVLSSAVSDELLVKVQTRISAYDDVYSRFRDDTLVSKMAASAGDYELPPDGPKLFELYKKVYDITQGKVTPLIGSVMEEAGYDKEYSLVPKTLHVPPSWEEAMSLDGRMLTMKQSALIDIGAAGKGYLIDLVADVLRDAGQHSFTIDAGGDIVHKSETNTPLRIGLENPNDITSVIGSITLGNESIAGSAGNRRAWGKYHHIIDPMTLESPTDILATWVIADSTLLADMLATCLFFVPAEKLLGHFSFSYITLHKDFSVEYSPRIKAELY